MPTVNFYRKKCEEGSDSLVYLQMKYHGQKFVYSCKFNVSSRNWDEKKQLVKERSATTNSGKIHLNTRLKDMREVCTKAFNIESEKGIPTNTQLKKHLDAYMYQNTNRERKVKEGPTLYGLINKFITGEIGDKKSEATITTYRTTLKHLQNFEKKENYHIDFDTITLEFKYKFAKFLSKEKRIDNITYKALSQNSIKKEIKNVRTFMNMAVELGYTTNLAFKSKKFGVKEVDTVAVYLTENELRKLYDFDFTANKRLEGVRDLFVFSSFVGLRYSDANNLKPENIITMEGENYIKVIAKKTGIPVTIPCNDIVLKIFKKYAHRPNKLPPSISNQKYNNYLKELCETAGLTETGRLHNDLAKPLFSCISAHTARRNFATNCSLSGMDSRMIMAITGHKTEKSFEKYLKMSREETAKKMAQHMKVEFSKRILKAVN
jgi:integrase